MGSSFDNCFYLGLMLVLTCAGDRESQISRSVLNSWCNDTVQDAARHVVELEGDVSVLRKEMARLQQSMAEKEEERIEAESQLRVQFLGEKRQLQRSCMEKELVVQLKLGAERDAVAADLAQCRATRQAMISKEECNYEKHVVLSKCEAELDSYAVKLGLQKKLVDRSPDEVIQPCSCADSDSQQPSRVRRLEESLGNCRYAAR